MTQGAAFPINQKGHSQTNPPTRPWVVGQLGCGIRSGLFRAIYRAICPHMTDKHPKRPRDPNQLAKSIIDIVTGERPDRDPTPEEQGKDPAAVALGKKGGKARADSMTAEKRSEIARKAASKRWTAD
jgi:hypothetical protein